MKNTSDNATPKWLVEFASGLRKIRSVADELGDLGKTSLQVLKNVGRINNAIESTSTKLSFVSTSAELARFTELSAKVKNELEEALKWRSAFTDELKPQSDEDIAAFISKMLEYKPNGLTMEEAKRAETPAAKAYARYSASILFLSALGERLADWLECKAAALTGETKQPPVEAVLVGEQAEELADIGHNAKIAAARTMKELNAKSKGGKKGAAVAKAERGEDKERKAILDEAKNMLGEWDERYPDRHKQPRDEQHSDAAAFRIVANRHRGADGKPIMSADTIGRTLRREKAKGEKRGKYSRTGKKRGKYKPRT